MSYILEALKKSERERGHGAAPNVQTIHSASLNYRQQEPAIWPYILIAVVALNLVALLYFMFADNLKTTEAVNELLDKSPLTLQDDSIAPVATFDTTQSFNTRSLEQSYETEIDDQVVTPIVTETYNAAETEVTNIHDLPLKIQQQIPTMNFSAHVYSSNAVQRSVVINNRFMEEGETLVDGIVLTEITSDGIIFDFQGYRISTGVITNWDIR